MAEYKAKSTETLVFNLTQNDILVGKMTYKNWLSFKSTILFADKSSFEVEPTGFWKTNIEIKKDETVIIKMKMNWDSEDVLVRTLGENKQDFIFKHIGNLKQTIFSLANDYNQALLTITYNEKWNATNYEYNITTNENFENTDDKELLVMASVYLMNSFITSTETLLTTAII